MAVPSAGSGPESERRPTSSAFAIAALIVVTLALALWLMGRLPICKCGYVKLWQGEVMSAENSQHLIDWYTPSHVVHGLLFYLALSLAMPRSSVVTRFLMALGVEAAWELLENTPWVIDRYRATTISLDYYGDSIVNSVSDVLAMTLGFLLAARLPVAASVALGVGLELFTGYMIRDNLLLNVIMLVYPLDVIRAWQSGG